MGAPKLQLAQQRKAKLAVLKAAKVSFEDHMAHKRQLRQLFKVELPRRRRLSVIAATVA